MIKQFKQMFAAGNWAHPARDSVKRQLLLLVVLFAAMSILRPSLFLSSSNLNAMAYQFPEYGLIALGVLFAMIAGGIDLSLIGIANLTAILMAKLLISWTKEEMSGIQNAGIFFICFLLCMAVGAACGMLNGCLISGLKIPAMLATLGSLQLFSGIGMIITKGKAITGVPETYVTMGTGKLFGFLPVPLVIYIGAVFVCHYVMSRSTFGMRLKLMGTSQKAALFAGQNNKRTTVKAHMAGGMLASFSGFIMLARMNSARPDFGSSYTMQSILIVVLGGVNPAGGFGTVKGVVLATLILQCFSSGLNMFPAISPYLKQLAWGLTLLAVMIMNFYSRQRKAE